MLDAREPVASVVNDDVELRPNAERAAHRGKVCGVKDENLDANIGGESRDARVNVAADDARARRREVFTPKLEGTALLDADFEESDAFLRLVRRHDLHNGVEVRT